MDRATLLENGVLTRSLLYLDDVRVTFDGYKALRGLSLVCRPTRCARSSARTAPARRR